MALESGIDIEYYCDGCECLGSAIMRINDTEYYCLFVIFRGGQYRQELMVNITLFVMSVWLNNRKWNRV